MYIEKYKGLGPGIFSRPILVLNVDAPTNEIQNAIEQCEIVLKENESLIQQENSKYDYMQMEALLFKNFKSVKIKASRNAILKDSVLVTYQNSSKPFVAQATAVGRNMVIRKEIPLTQETPLSQIAQHIKELLS
ncbi:MAG: hypothetical protein IJC70_05645 [Firmicutes bacterium]|nr:hypothetical protein [Bacillota bacterium]